MIAQTAIQPVTNTRAFDAALDPETLKYLRESRERFKAHGEDGRRSEFAVVWDGVVVGCVAIYRPADDPQLGCVGGAIVPVVLATPLAPFACSPTVRPAKALKGLRPGPQAGTLARVGPSKGAASRTRVYRAKAECSTEK